MAFRGAVCLLGGNANGGTKKKKKKGLLGKGKDGDNGGGDVTPLDTLKRELNEELLSPDWVNRIQQEKVIDDSKLVKTSLYNTTSLSSATTVENTNNNNNFDDGRYPGTIRYLGTTLHSHTAKLIDKPNPYAFYCALYEITIGIDQLPHSILHPVGATIQEGRLALLTQDQLLQHAKYAWGYEYTMETYFGRKSWNKQEGASVSEVEENIWETTSWTPLT